MQHQLFYAYVKHLWAVGETKQAMERLTSLANVVDMIAHCQESQGNNLRVACWLKLGEWKIEELHPPGAPLTESKQKEVLMAFKRATANNSSRYKAWHAWALINFRLAQQISESRQHFVNISNVNNMNKVRPTSISLKALRNHVVAAVQGFVQAICLGTKRWSASVQQDLLNFLTCLFKYGEMNEMSEVAEIIKAEIGAVTLEAWLGVLPQLLARIHIKSPPVRSVLHPLLISLGENHPRTYCYWVALRCEWNSTLFLVVSLSHRIITFYFSTFLMVGRRGIDVSAFCSSKKSSFGTNGGCSKFNGFFERKLGRSS